MDHDCWREADCSQIGPTYSQQQKGKHLDMYCGLGLLDIQCYDGRCAGFHELLELNNPSPWPA